jgi:hypothetical protein
VGGLAALFGHERRHERVLRGIPLPRVPEHEERHLFEIRVFLDHEILDSLFLREPPCLPLNLHPTTPLVVARVPEQAPQNLVPGLPDGR